MYEHYLMLVLTIGYVQQIEFSLYRLSINHTVCILRYSRRFEGKISYLVDSESGGLRLLSESGGRIASSPKITPIVGLYMLLSH